MARGIGGKCRTVFPAPVGCATFAGGETIRMSFWQPANKPWRFEPVRRWLCQIIGNERGRSGKLYAEGRANLDRRLAAAKQLAAAPGTKGEETAARAAVKRLERAKKEAMTEVFNGLAFYTKVWPAAADMTDFWVEHDGKTWRPESLAAPTATRSAHANNYDRRLANLRELVAQYDEMFPEECRAARQFVALVERIAA